MRLKDARMSVGLTQEAVAKAMDISRTTVAMWETGQVNPTADKLPQLAKLYECTIDELFIPEDENHDEAGLQR